MDKNELLFLFTFIYFLSIKTIVRNKNNRMDINKKIEIKNLFVYNYSFLSNYRRFFRIIFFIESCVNHLNKRKKIKNTWIKKCLRMSCIYYFVIATKGKNHIIFKEWENNIIGVDIIDNYYNLTILTANIFKYFVYYNFKCDYVIINDDDIFPNIPVIMIFLNIYINKSRISGYFYSKTHVKRNINSTVYLPKSIYENNIFPEFVAGGFVIISSNLVLSIYSQLCIVKTIIYREDMHMAIIYKKLGIKFQKLNKYYPRKEKFPSNKMKMASICWHGF